MIIPKDKNLNYFEICEHEWKCVWFGNDVQEECLKCQAFLSQPYNSNYPQPSTYRPGNTLVELSGYVI